MKKYIFRILFIALVVVLFYKINAFAAHSVEVDKENIIVKIKKDATEKTLPTKLVSEGMVNGSHKYKIIINENGGERIYIGDTISTIAIPFSVDQNWTFDNKADGVVSKQSKWIDNGKTVSFNGTKKFENRKSYEGKWQVVNGLHVLGSAIAQNIGILKTDNNKVVKFQAYTEVSLTGVEWACILFDIEIHNVGTLAEKCRDELVHTYHWREVLTTGSTMDVMARNQITSLQVMPSQINNANPINFQKNDRFKDKGYDKFYLGMGNTVNFKPDGRKTTTSVCDVKNETTDPDSINEDSVTKNEYSWRELNITANVDYVFKYCFAYFEDLPADKKMVYVCFARRVEAQEGETDEEALERTMEEMDEVGMDYVEDVLNEIKLGISLSMGNIGFDRNSLNYGRMVDALADNDFYTNIDGLEEDDVYRVEEKAGKIVSVVTNIGIILSVLVPAILGIKYMLGSVNDKAEYKEDILPYLIGAVLLFGVCSIVKILQAIGNAINQI